jgi:hypothetical protein
MRRRGVPGAALSFVVVAALLALVPGTASALAPVHCDAGGNLQARLDAAPPGATLLIDGTCEGPFTVGKDVTIQGHPTAALDGGQLGTTLAVNTPHVVHLAHLVITGGWSENGVGGGVSVGGGTLFLDHVTVSGNVSTLSTGTAQACGGGVRGLSGATIHITHSSILNNIARTAQPSPSGAFGGGVCTTDQSPVTVVGSHIAHNRVSMAGAGGTAHVGGAGIAVLDAPLTISSTTVTANVAASDGAPAEIDGAGIWNPSVHVPTVARISGSTIQGNRATAHSGSSDATVFGGGVNGDTVTVSGSKLSGNELVGTADGGFAKVEGGGVWAGTVTLTNSVASSNSLRAAGGFAGQAHGGGIWSDHRVTLTSSTVNANTIFASGDGAGASAGASGLGGGIASGTLATLTDAHLTGNSVRTTASQAHATADGGGIDGTGEVRAVRSTVSGNSASASSHGSDYALAAGGGVEAADVTVSTTTLDSNHTSATSPGNSTTNAAGVFAHGSLHLSMSMVSDNVARATANNGGLASAISGAIDAGGSAQVVNSTLAGNSADAVADASSGEARAFGGVTFPADSTVTFEASTLVRNSVSAHAHTATAQGGGVTVGFANLTITSSILALNTAPSGPDCSGGIDSGGHNLVGKTAGCAFSKKPSDKVNVANAHLGPLQANGGPTPTVALLPGSPALDWIPAAQCGVTADQRGVHRPQGPKCDIGSYERKP